MNENIRLTNLLKNKHFETVYERLLGKKDLIERDSEYLLTCIIVLLRIYNSDKRYKKTFNFAYHLLVVYTIKSKHYRPLFDVSIELGYYPIVAHIINKKLISFDESSFNDIVSYEFIKEFYTKVEQENKYILTKKQSSISKAILSSSSQNVSFIAPTSFGKSSIIKDIIDNNVFKKICIVVPSKSLIQQNLQNFGYLSEQYSIIFHDEMFQSQSNVLCILTQERAIRILDKISSFDAVFIDEAHNIFDFSVNNYRGIALTKFISLSLNGNESTKFFYLSPAIENSNNVLIEGQKNISEFRISNNIKTDLYYYYRDNIVSQFDKYTGSFFNEQSLNLSMEQYIVANSADKNFVYNFRPKNIELVAKELGKKVKKSTSIKLQKLKKILINEVHSDFILVELVEKGIVYLHAKIPNLIKEYLESQFKETDEIKYLIANSVVLEGINLPIQKLFITSTSELKYNHLINLIGRVNRLNYVFKNDDLDSLLCDIHFVEDKKLNKGHSLQPGLNRLREVIKDQIKNPLLSEYDINALEFTDTKDGKSKREKKQDREVLDEMLKSNLLFETVSKEDTIVKYLIDNNFEEFYDIKSLRFIAQKVYEKRKNDYSRLEIIDIVNEIMIKDFRELIVDESLKRLSHQPTREYYSFYLNKLRKLNYRDAVLNVYSSFLKKAKSGDPFLYFGRSYGEVARSYQNSKYAYLNKVYIDLSDQKYSKADLVNLAVVKLKIEEDFTSYYLTKIISFLYKFEYISVDVYNEFAYGTTNEKYLKYIYLGISISTIKKLIDDNQIRNIDFKNNTTILPNEEFIEYFHQQAELFKFELKKYIKI